MTVKPAALFHRAKGGAEGAAQTVRHKRPFLDHLVRTVARYRADAGRRLAAAVSYYAFLSFFPLLALAYSITGFVLDAFPDAEQRLTDQINSYLPGLADQLNIASIGNARIASGIIGVVGLLLAGLAWVNAMREAMRTIWHHNIQFGNLIVRWLYDTFILIGLGLALILTTAVTGAASAGTTLVLDALDLSGSTVATYLLRGLGIVVALAGDTIIYTFLFTRLPKVAVPIRRVLRGALFAAAGLEILKIGGAYLIPGKASNPVYLTFGVLFGLLIWINIVSRWTLLAAAWTVTGPYDTDIAPSGTASVGMAKMAGIPEEYASDVPDEPPATMAGGVPTPLHAAVQGRTPAQDEPVGREGEDGRSEGDPAPVGLACAGPGGEAAGGEVSPSSVTGPAPSGKVSLVRPDSSRPGRL